jgi:predicted RND superfamily exporter protein
MQTDLKRPKNKFLETILAHPKRVILITLTLSILAIIGMKNLRLIFNHKVWFDKDHSLILGQDFQEKTFGAGESSVLILNFQDKATNHLKLLQSLIDELSLLDEVLRVDALNNFQWVHSVDDDIFIEPLFDFEKYSSEQLQQREQVIKADKDLQNYLITKDLKTTLIHIYLTPSFEKPHKFNKVSKKVRDVANKLIPGEVDVHHLGLVAVNGALIDATFKDLKTMFPLLIFILIALIFYFFKEAKAVFFILNSITLSMLTTLGLMGYFGFPLVNISSILPVILMAIAIADSVHIVDSYKKNKSLAEAAAANFRPTLLTSLTTAIGFFSLTLAEMKPIQHFGLMAGIGVMLAWIYTYTLLIPSIQLFPLNFFRRDIKFKIPWKKYIEHLHRHHLKYIVFFLGLTTILIIKSRDIQVYANPMKNFDHDHPVAIANDFVQSKFGGLSGPQIIIDSGKTDGTKSPEFLSRVQEFEQWLLSDPRINHVNSFTTVTKRLNRSLNGDHQKFYRLPKKQTQVAELAFLYNLSVPPTKSLTQYLSSDYRYMKLGLLWTIDNSIEGLNKMNEIKKWAKKYDLEILITGKVAIKQNMVKYVISTFLNSIFIAALIIILLFALIYRNFETVFLVFFANLTPAVFAAGLLGLIGAPVDFTIALVSSICLGIAVDDTIHFIDKYNQHKAMGDTTLALTLVMDKVASALMLTTLILCLGFGVFFFSEHIPNRNFGILSSFVMAMALITDLVLLPSLIIAKKRFIG